jgi:hypothetical protein
LARNIDCEDSNHAISSCLLLPLSAQDQLSSSASYFQKPSGYVPPLIYKYIIIIIIIIIITLFGCIIMTNLQLKYRFCTHNICRT